VQGNRIGTDTTGAAALGNGGNGVDLTGVASNIVGGTASGAGNLLSGNVGDGILITASASSNVVQGNTIGTNAAGTAKLGNAAGIVINGASNNTVGGTAAGAGNLVSGNTANGISIFNRGSGNLVQGNRVGTDPGGTANLGNGGNGVSIISGSNNVIGGSAAGAGNTIAFSGGAGVAIAISSSTHVASSGDTIRGNAIFASGGLGIDLRNDGVTANDPSDADGGPNNLQNFPTLTAASSSLFFNSTGVGGTLNSTPSTTFTLDFFASAAADPTGFGEGQTFLGASTVTTDASGNASFSVGFARFTPRGNVITATATDPGGNTSEYSLAKVIGPRMAIGTDAGDPPIVNVYDAPTGILQYSFQPYPDYFHGGVRVAVGDVNGDDVPDIITAPGPGSALPVQVFDGDTGQPIAGLLASFFPFGPHYSHGLFVAVGAFGGGPGDDIVISKDAGSTPLVEVYSSASGTRIAHVQAFPKGFHGGVRIAVGDVNGDGHDDIVVSAGAGVPRVKVFDGTNLNHVLRSFLAFPRSFHGGVYVAAGDLDGDHRAEIIAGMGPGGQPVAQVFDGTTGTPGVQLQAADATFTGGVRVGLVRDLNGDGLPEIITGTGPGGGSEVRVFDGLTQQPLDDLFADDATLSGGVFVAGRR
jgi:hypothetical protein